VKKEYTALHTRLTDTNDQRQRPPADSERQTVKKLRTVTAQQEETVRLRQQMEQITQELKPDRETIRQKDEILRYAQEETAGAWRRAAAAERERAISINCAVKGTGRRRQKTITS